MTSEGIRFSVRTNEPSEDGFGDEVKRSKPQKQRPWVREEMVVLVAIDNKDIHYPIIDEEMFIKYFHEDILVERLCLRIVSEG